MFPLFWWCARSTLGEKQTRGQAFSAGLELADKAKKGQDNGRERFEEAEYTRRLPQVGQETRREPRWGGQLVGKWADGEDIHAISRSCSYIVVNLGSY